MTNLSDTDPAAQSFLIDGYRLMPPAARLRLALEMSQTVIELAKAGILKRYPAISQSEMGKRLGAILWGRELSIKVNHWDPEKEGY
ncbi:MAG TPA: hypothetical protein VN426_12200 [Syntrophomonadaceae bacterium]|nr:hypothetical protein [Syntrophomonadaceae bacterium]